MSSETQARALMMRHHHLVKNRQQSMLDRAAAEIGVSVNGEFQGNSRRALGGETYDRSNASLS